MYRLFSILTDKNKIVNRNSALYEKFFRIVRRIIKEIPLRTSLSPVISPSNGSFRSDSGSTSGRRVTPLLPSLPSGTFPSRGQQGKGRTCASPLGGTARLNGHSEAKPKNPMGRAFYRWDSSVCSATLRMTDLSTLFPINQKMRLAESASRIFWLFLFFDFCRFPRKPS